MYEREQDILSKALRAGRRTYFFDVKATKAGDYYLTVTESKKFTNEDGSFHFKKHKIYLYKEDFNEFKSILNEMTKFIIDEKGEEKSLGIMMPGEYNFGTGKAELMEIISGEVEVKIAGENSWTLYEGDSEFDVPANSNFDIKVKTITDYCCSYIN